MGRLIAIGDIHGCYYTLRSLLDKIQYDYKSDHIVFIGDYIDRGAHSYEVVQFISQLQRHAPRENVKCLMGNHEKMMIDSVENNNSYLWLYNGGLQTIYSYQNNGCEIERHLFWMKRLPVYIQVDKYIFCHAGLQYPRLEDNEPKDMLWSREWIERNDPIPREKTVIFGHTPLEIGKQIMQTGDIGIDTGCVFGGYLCAFIDDGEEYSFEYEPFNPKDGV